ncbi:E3 ubiquitin-protein ligase ATL41 [Vitis vinifera]|uniref:E3 ubiquitin-protein ligase ATL41 n=1 Tax=Vitis vinifera TaxID=29760 RepID=A0A438EG89_VITVI|nr:E3 ubiquitin-protein ligase ATL41 [Vitis vinifera]
MSFPFPPMPYSTPLSSDDDDDNGSYTTSHKSSSDLNSKIMLTAIVSLSVVIALVITLHIYARCVLRRRARRRSALLSITLSRVHSDEPPKTGLDQSVIDSLPMFKFSENDTQEEGGTTDCAINGWAHTQRAPSAARRLSPACSPSPVGYGHDQDCSPAPAPPSDGTNSSSLACSEGTSEGAAQCSAKSGASTSRLSSFRRMLSRDHQGQLNPVVPQKMV